MSKYLTTKCCPHYLRDPYDAPVPWVLAVDLGEASHKELLLPIRVEVQMGIFRDWAVDLPSPVALGLEG